MDYKEAIEFLDDIFSKCKLKKCNLYNLNKIIYLLEQGEAYRQIVKELKEFYGNGILENECGIGVQLKNLIEILEQKYLKEYTK